MLRSCLLWLVLGLATGLSGCTTCASPFDYCGPVRDYRAGYTASQQAYYNEDGSTPTPATTAMEGSGTTR